MNENQIDINSKKCEFYKGICKNSNNCQGFYETKIGKKLDRCVRHMNHETNPALILNKSFMEAKK